MRPDYFEKIEQNRLLHQTGKAHPGRTRRYHHLLKQIVTDVPVKSLLDWGIKHNDYSICHFVLNHKASNITITEDEYKKLKSPGLLSFKDPKYFTDPTEIHARMNEVR